ncbi:MAG: acetyl-CoA carboxylase biotin carboxylase subunit [Pararhodobacter sp.]
MTGGADTILIANRGEIALRVMRTARAMGYGCAVVHTPDDADAAHFRDADRAVCVPSYLDGAAILAAARALGAGMVHPGYGYLSENAGFAAVCAEAGVRFIGPAPEAIALMGDKGRAKRAALAAGVPVLPGAEGGDLLAEGARIGVPLMVKAALGGGGRGMRLVTDLADLPEALTRARSEAEKGFGDGALILEKALMNPRHIEVQVFGDSHGTVVHLGERDCSVQRRHQKVIEEAPSPAVDGALREALGASAVALARACGYVGAGTVEFLLEDGAFWFLEMNTRLQVEHPVTEAVTGLDLVEWQIRVARGEALPLAQEDIRLRGHAIEARLYAEDPAQGFLPQMGRVLAWAPGAGLRCDDALRAGDTVGGGFDPMLAKLVAHGPDRDTARRRLIAGLEATRVQGLATNRAFLVSVLSHAAFRAGPTTAFLARDFAGDASLSPTPPDAAVLAAAVLIGAGGPAPRFGFSTGPAPVLTRRFACGADTHTVTVRLGPGAVAAVPDGPVVTLHAMSDDIAEISVDGVRRRWPIARDGATLWIGEHALRDETLSPPAIRAEVSDGVIVAPMAGTLIALAADPGARVEAGQVLGVIEAMKMEHPLRAPLSGRIGAVHVRAGSQLRARQPLIEIEAEDP